MITIIKILYYIMFYIIMIISFLFHELGHYFVSKHYKIPVYEIHIGKGPVIFKKSYNNTDFIVSLIPICGYNIIDVEKEKKLSILKRFNIDMAGIFINLIIVIIAILYLNIFNSIFFTYFLLEILRSYRDKEAILGSVPYYKNIDIAMISFILINSTIFIENILPFPHLDGGKLLHNIKERVIYNKKYSSSR